MAKLTASARKKVRVWGLPKQRKFPLPDASHARNAKARASEMEHKGRLSKAQESAIDTRADKVLGKGESSVKKKEAPKKKEVAKKPAHKKATHKKTDHVHEAKRHAHLAEHHGHMAHEHLEKAAGIEAGDSGKMPRGGKKDAGLRKPPTEHGYSSPNADWGSAKRIKGASSREGM